MSLISKIAYHQPADNQPNAEVLVWKHSLPFVQASKSPAKIALGEIAMDKTSPDTSKILNDYGGDLRLFQGHLGLGLKHGYIPLLLEIKEGFEVQNSQLLLEVLLDPQRLKLSGRKNANESRQAKTGAKKSGSTRGNRGKR